MTNCSKILNDIICWPICASSSDVALLLVNRLKTNIFFVNVPLKLLLPEAFFSPKCTKYCLAVGCRPGPLGSLQRSLDPLAEFKGPTSKGRGGRRRRVGKGRKRWERRGEYASSALGWWTFLLSSCIQLITRTLNLDTSCCRFQEFYLLITIPSFGAIISYVCRSWSGSDSVRM